MYAVKELSLSGIYLNPDIAFNKLLFPAPDGPIIADSWPFLNTPLTPCSKHFFFESVTVVTSNKKKAKSKSVNICLLMQIQMQSNRHS